MAVIPVDPPKETYTAGHIDEPIEVRATIGDGQSGSWSVFLNSSYKGSNNAITLGTGGEVTGKTTRVIATITDTLEETNWTSVTVYITEAGVKTKFGPYKKEVPKHMDTAVYTITIEHA
jgi:hypothetical protein